MKSAPHLQLVWNRDWVEPVSAFLDPSTFVGVLYQNALNPPDESEFEGWEKTMQDFKANASV